MGPIDLGPAAIAGAAALVLVNGALSVWLQLGLGRKILVAAARTLVQLLCLGLVLQWVFDEADWPKHQARLAAREATRRVVVSRA